MSAKRIRLSVAQETPPLSGAGLLGLVTTGLYDDPLSIYREYIQNSADAAEGSTIPPEARVDITVDPMGRYIRIHDNGPGLSRDDAFERLLPVGRSEKRPAIDRGFRGVGRLAGLAFAKTVTFTTRSCKERPITRITWHNERLLELTSTESELEKAILDCVDVETLPGSEYPEHFFEVEIRDVARHAAGVLLNRDAVRDYIGEVCPVPLSADFPFAPDVDELFNGIRSPFALEVMLEGDSAPVRRPYGASVPLSSSKSADFTEFQIVRIPSVDDGAEAAIGWIAHSTYLGAIPREHRIRGIRARVGNIQIGNETTFDDLFVEERFNRWCVGELHILDSRIVPNTKRDYFQPGPHLRNLENELSPVLRCISTRCRQESKERNRDRKFRLALDNIDDLIALATSGYLAAQDSTDLVKRAERELSALRKKIGNGRLTDGVLQRLESTREGLVDIVFDDTAGQFQGMTPSQVVIYQNIFRALADLASSPSSARALIELVFAEASAILQVDDGLNANRPANNHSQARLVLDDTGKLIPR